MQRRPAGRTGPCRWSCPQHRNGARLPPWPTTRSHLIRTRAVARTPARRSRRCQPWPTSRPPGSPWRGSRVAPRMEGSRPLSEAVGGPVFLKCENLQRAGSFKIRGAYNRIARLAPEERARGVVAASAGNHAQGVALASQLLGISSTVFMPEGATIPKIAATRAYGAEVRLYGQVIDDCLDGGAGLRGRDRGGAHPPLRPRRHRGGTGHRRSGDPRAAPRGEDHRGVHRRRRSARRDRSGRESRCAPTSGWSGFRPRRPRPTRPRSPLARRSPCRPWPRWRTASPSGGPATSRSRSSRISWTTSVRSPRRICRARSCCASSGPSSSSSRPVQPRWPAIMADPTAFEPPVVAVLSGGNIDPVLLLRVIRHGLAAGGRYLALHVRVPDRPGNLARLLAHAGRHRRQRPRGRAPAHRRRPAGRRGRDRPPAGDAGAGALRSR